MNIKKGLMFVGFMVSIVLSVLKLYTLFIYSNIIPFHMIIFNYLFLFVYIFLLVCVFINAKSLSSLKLDLEQCKNKNQTLSALNDSVRGFRHDFNNIITTIGGYISTSDIAGLKKYYNQIAVDCMEINNLTMLNTSIINEPAIYNLVVNKYMLACENSITFNIEILLDLKTLNIKIYEFTRILGILLDNAIEASKECTEKAINLSIKKDLTSPRQLLLIENTYNNKDVDIENIFKKGISSKPHNTGIGLWEVRQILNRNDNLNLYTTKDDKFFKQQLEIYL
ncbi:MAG: GHKL domain-containing protein [Clostridia bacterium]|nr:GHKL domain-containing protein [Clostridia bacterium]